MRVRLDIESNFSAITQAESHMEGLGRQASSAAQTMNNSFRGATNSVSAFDNQLRTANTDLDRLQRNAQTPAALGRSFAGATTQARSFGNSVTNMATGFIAGTVITAGMSKISGAMSHAIDVQKEFEKSIQNLSAITGASGADLEFYKQKAVELGVSVKGGAVAAVEAFKLIGSAKPELLANKEALAQVTEQAILLSQASGLELPDAATRLTDAMNQFGAGSEQAGLFVDTLAAAAKFGAAEVPQVTDALLKFGVAAKSSNISIQESAAAIELLAEKGLKGSEAGTALRNIFAKLSATKVLPKEAKAELAAAGVDLKKLGDTSIPVQQRLQELSKIQSNAAALTRVFGLENKIAAQSLLENLPRLKELTTQIGEQGLGSALEQSSKNMDTLDQAMIEAGNQYDNFLLSITQGDFGELIKGYVKSVGEGMGFLATVFSDRGFNGVVNDNIDKFAKETTKNLSEAKKKQFAAQLAYEIKSINGQLKYNQSLSHDQIVEYEKAIKFKARVIGQLIDLDKKKVEASKQIVAEDPDMSEETAAERKKAAERYKKLKEDLTNALLDLAKRAAKAEIEILSDTDENKIKKAGVLAMKEFEFLKQSVFEKGKLVDKNFKFTVEQEQQLAVIKQQINQDTAEKLLQLEIKKSTAIAQQHKQEIDDEKKFVELKTRLSTAQISVAGNDQGLPEEQFELLKQRVLLQVKRKGSEDSLLITKQEIQAEADIKILALENEFKALQNSTDKDADIRRGAILDNISAIQKNTSAELDVVVAETAVATDQIAKEINEIDKKLNKKPDWLKALGITKDDLNNIQAGFSELQKMGDAALDVQISDNKKVIDSSKEKQDQLNSEIEDLKSKLESEKDSGARGLANNESRILAEISQKENQREAEHQLELQALERRKTLQKQKLLLDSVLQLSNLAVAATEIYAKAAASTGPASVPIAAAAIGLMFAGFIVQKALALKAINEGNEFAEGVYNLKGPGTETSDSIDAKLSRGETVIRAKTTREHGPLLKALHEDNKVDYRNALISELLGTGITLSKQLPVDLNSQKASIRNSELKLSIKTDNSLMEKRLAGVEAGVNKIVKQGETKTVVMENGDIYVTKGSNTKIIRAKNK